MAGRLWKFETAEEESGAASRKMDCLEGCEGWGEFSRVGSSVCCA